jgi:hypothetical protein
MAEGKGFSARLINTGYFSNFQRVPVGLCCFPIETGTLNYGNSARNCSQVVAKMRPQAGLPSDADHQPGKHIWQRDLRRAPSCQPPRT